MGLGLLLEACQVHEKVALEHSSKSTKCELKGSYDDPVHENVSCLKTAKLPQSSSSSSSSTVVVVVNRKIHPGSFSFVGLHCLGLSKIYSLVANCL